MSRKPLVIKRGRDFMADPPVSPSPPVPVSTSPHVPMSPSGRRRRKNGTHKKAFYLPEDLCRALRQRCADDDVTESAVAVVALRKHLGVK